MSSRQTSEQANLISVVFLFSSVAQAMSRLLTSCVSLREERLDESNVART
jgi:hypothetical protein